MTAATQAPALCDSFSFTRSTSGGMPPVDAARPAVPMTEPDPEPDTGRDAILKRLWRTAEKQVREIERRLLVAGQEPDERERDARLMAVLVKTVAELSALDNPPPKAGGKTTAGAAKSTPASAEYDDDDGPRDIDEFRRELARRIAALAGPEAATAAEGDEPA